MVDRVGSGAGDDDEHIEEIIVPVVVLFIVVVLTLTITGVSCVCWWKRRERRLLQLMHKKEQKLESGERVVSSRGYSNVLENVKVMYSPTAETKPINLTASNEDVTKAQLRDEGYAEIKTTDDQENGYDKLTSNAQLSSADQQHGYFVLEQNSTGDEHIDGYQQDLKKQEPFFEPATREEELFHQLAELKVESIPERNVEIMDYLGSGQFGTVNKAKWTHRDEEGADVATEVAVKTMTDGSTEEDKIKFLQEAAIMGQFKNCNILRILGVIMDGDTLKIVVDLMHNGDLSHHLKTLRDTNGEYQAFEIKQMLMSFTRQVALGLAYLSCKEYVHRDLAARNVLVSEDGMCKIADFGLSRDLRNENYYRSHGGKIPVKWTAPEALNYRKYSTASDVWSYGCLLYEIWTIGEKPFGNFSNVETMRVVSNGYRLPPPPGCPRPIYKIMIDCWHPVPESRPRALRIVAGLQRPDFVYLKWSPKEVNLYSEDSRTLGTLLENGQSLHKDLQIKYLDDEPTVENENGPSNIVHDSLGVSNNNDTMLQGQGNKGRSEGGESARPEASGNEVLSIDVQTSIKPPQNEIENANSNGYMCAQ